MVNTELHLRVRGRHMYDVISCAVHNATNGKLRIGAIIVGGEDTTMIYELSVDSPRKLRKDQLAWLRAFIDGISYGQFNTIDVIWTSYSPAVA